MKFLGNVLSATRGKILVRIDEQKLFVTDIFVVDNIVLEDTPFDDISEIIPLLIVESTSNMMDPAKLVLSSEIESENFVYDAYDDAIFRFATLEEVTFFNDFLKSKGYRWDGVKLRLARDISKPAVGQHVWRVELPGIQDGKINSLAIEHLWEDTLMDDYFFCHGLIFETEDKANELADKLTTAVNKVLYEFKP